MTVARQRVGFRSSWNIAMGTVSVWAGGALPFAHALIWWFRGVPMEKVEQAAQGSSRWDRMTQRERRVSGCVTGGCVVVFVIVVVVVLTGV